MASSKVKSAKPGRDVIEITVLGRGLGEAIVLHTGDGEWIVIDCFRTGSGYPAPLAYLDSIEVDHSAIKVILATHWHDDHVRGIADLYQAASEAEFFLSLALERDEFAGFIGEALHEDARPFSAGVRELVSVDEINERDARRPVVLVSASQTLFLRDASQTSFGARIEIKSLSPSPADIVDFVSNLRSVDTGHATRLPLPDRNPASVACWAEFGEFSAILGADLEVGSKNTGWAGVLASRTLPSSPASYFKVPHHGSATGHNDDVWANLLVPNVPAVLAPWTRGGKALPSTADVARIKTKTHSLYTAKSTGLVSPKSLSSSVIKLLNASQVKLNSFPANFGLVQLRRKVSDDAWAVSLSEDAAKL